MRIMQANFQAERAAAPVDRARFGDVVDAPLPDSRLLKLTAKYAKFGVFVVVVFFLPEQKSEETTLLDIEFSNPSKHSLSFDKFCKPTSHRRTGGFARRRCPEASA